MARHSPAYADLWGYASPAARLLPFLTKLHQVPFGPLL